MPDKHCPALTGPILLERWECRRSVQPFEALWGLWMEPRGAPCGVTVPTIHSPGQNCQLYPLNVLQMLKCTSFQCTPLLWSRRHSIPADFNCKLRNVCQLTIAHEVAIACWIVIAHHASTQIICKVIRDTQSQTVPNNNCSRDNRRSTQKGENSMVQKSKIVGSVPEIRNGPFHWWIERQIIQQYLFMNKMP